MSFYFLSFTVINLCYFKFVKASDIYSTENKLQQIKSQIILWMTALKFLAYDEPYIIRMFCD